MENNNEILEKTSEIVSSYLSNTHVNFEDLPKIIQLVHTELCDLVSEKPSRPDPAVPISKSVQENHIVCLEDGAKLKMLKRYLKTRYNLTPDEYRARWNLPKDYPMVAPEYSRRRSKFAKELGLGKN